jgi:group I intron endonuclease
MFYVYKITNLVNGKVYIGKSGHLEKRWRNHLSIAARGKQDPSFSIIHAAIRKYGKDNFRFEIIESHYSEQESFDREKYWITECQSNIYKHGSKYGYNLTDGGEGPTGCVPSEETRKKISEACSGEKNGFYGKEHTVETKQILSKTKKEYFSEHPANFLGQKHSDESKKLLSESRSNNFNLYSELNKGSKNPKAKLTESDVVKIYSMIVDGYSDQEIEKYFDVGEGAIIPIRLGKTWKHVARPTELTDGRMNLTKEKVIEIIDMIKSGIDNITIAIQFNTSPRKIQRIRNGAVWKNIPR